jgi:nucleoside-diphosphate-sugar epimerase
MRILVIGAGHTGARVVRELQKNPALTVLVADAQEEPYAVEEGIIEAVDYRESFTPFTLDSLLAQAQPDLVLLTRAPRDLGLGTAPGMDLFADSLRDELVTMSKVPMIQVAQTWGG